MPQPLNVDRLLKNPDLQAQPSQAGGGRDDGSTAGDVFHAADCRPTSRSMGNRSP